MSETRRFTALDWVRSEIEDTLRVAREALEAYAETPDDVTLVRQCLTSLHQVHGTLQMVELMGAAELAGEMEAVAQALLGRTLADVTAGQEALMEGILQLPGHLARVQQGGVDDAGIHRGLIIRLRAARGEADAEPDEIVEIDPASVSLFLSGKGPAAVRKLRSSYQRAMLALMRKTQPPDKLWPFFEKLFTRLEHVTPASPIARLWWLAAGAMERYSQRGGSIATMLPILRGLDQQLKELVEATEATLSSKAPAGLVEDLRAMIAEPSGEDSSRLLALRRAFPPPGQKPESSIPLGADAATIATVASALHEELRGIRDRLDLYVRGSSKDPDALARLGDDLQRISGTLAVVGLSGLRETTDRQAAWVRQQAHSGAIDDEALMEIAGAVLLVDSALMSMAGIEDEDGEAMPGSLSDAQAAVLREARVSLETVKQAIVDFVASEWDHAHLDPVAETLAAVRRVLQVVPLDRPAGLVDACRRFLVNEILSERLVPEWQRLDTLADAITSIDYFLERMLHDGGAMDPRVLDVAEESVRALGYDLEIEASPAPVSTPREAVAPAAVASATPEKEEFDLRLLGDDEPEPTSDADPEPAPASVPPAPPRPAATTVAPAGDDDSLIDDDIIEIFLEECGEVLETIDTHLATWREDLGDRPALTEIRRAFHTLKGSGRMVGATTMGEMAWSIENMLNRVLDGTVDASASVLQLVVNARDLVPELRAAFAERREPTTSIDEIVEHADVLASGGTLSDFETSEEAAEEDEFPIFADDDELAAPSAPATDDSIPELSGSEPLGSELPDLDAPDLETAEDALAEEGSVEAGFQPLPKLSEPRATEVAEDDFELVAELDDDFLGEAGEGGDDFDLDHLDVALDEEGSGAEPPAAFHLDDHAESLPIEEAGPATDAVIASSAAGMAGLDDDTVPPLPESWSDADADAATDAAGEIGLEPEALESEALEAGPIDGEAGGTGTAAVEGEADDLSDAAIELSVDLEAEVPGVLDATGVGAFAEPSADRSGDALETGFEAEAPSEAESGTEADAEFVFESEQSEGRPASAFDLPSGIAEPVEPDFDLADFDESSELEAGGVDTLLEIFDAEAIGHLAVLRAYLDDTPVDGEDGPVPQEQDLRRVLHTLKGSAAMAEFGGIAKLAAPLERLLRAHLELQRPIDPASRDLLAAGLACLDHSLTRLRETGVESVSGDAEADFLARTEARASELEDEIGAIHSGGREGTITRTVLQADGIGALIDAADQVRHRFEEGGAAEFAEVRRELQALAARAADASQEQIAELAAALDAAHELVEFRALDAANGELLAEAHETLVGMLDALAADLDVEADPGLIVRLGAIDVQLPVVDAGPAPESAPEPVSAAPVEAPASPSVARTSLVRESVADVDLDPEMAEIFFEEAEELLENIDNGFSAWSDGDRAGPDMLVRALHTLKGGARMAGLLGLGDEAHELETLIEANRSADAGGFLGTLRGGIDQLADHVATLRSGGTIERALAAGEMPVAEAPVSDVPVSDVPVADNPNTEAPRRTPADALPPRDAIGTDDLSGTDAEILKPFLEEATELTETIDAALLAWRREPDNELHLETLLRALHTLKGGARMAGLSALGEATHDLESKLAASRGRVESRDGTFFTNLQLNADALSGRIAAVADLARDASSKPAAPAPAEPQPPAVQATVPSRSPAGPVSQREAPVREANQEMIRVSASLLDGLANLAGESSILRGRVQQQIGDFALALDEMGATIERIRSQVRRVEMETEAQVLFRQERSERAGYEDFDPLEMDRYSQLQELTRTLAESASDVNDLRETLTDRVRDAETLLVQQGRIHTGLQEGLMRTRMVPFVRLLPRLKRIVRQIAREVGKRVELELRDAEGELDRNVLERMIPPLEHMLRNAVDHGIEDPAVREQRGKPAEGTIRLSLSREGGDILIEVADDGGGIDVQAVQRRAIDRGLLDAAATPSEDEILSFIMAPGFSTARNVTQISGRGVGMDVVNSEVKQLGGSISIASDYGSGTTIAVRLPFTVSVNRALMVTVGEDEYAVPLSGIEGIVRVSPQQLLRQYESDSSDFAYAGRTYELSYLGTWLGLPHRVRQDLPSVPVLMVRAGDRGRAVHVDTVAGSREIVVKSLGPQFAGVSGVSGATILGDGRVVVILDLPSLLRTSSQLRLSGLPEPEAPAAVAPPPEPTVTVPERTRVLVVDDSVTVRKVTTRLLERQGMQVSVAKDGIEAVGALAEQKPDVMLLDIEMPRMDGFEVAQHVRNEASLADLPIIMITSRTGDKHRTRAESLGVDRFLGKPFQEAELIATIEELTAK
ncbi:MAG: Hpt domain-containing protein [Pseudomonadales bacterium]|jgi:chemosensory pili system protein ChpA (sensor histidine kinase/response regulator)|nr:Hpt domain-containing protein [Pseudomonadales bacterium]